MGALVPRKWGKRPFCFTACLRLIERGQVLRYLQRDSPNKELPSLFAVGSVSSLTSSVSRDSPWGKRLLLNRRVCDLMVDHLLTRVQRPSRYLGTEVNVPRKRWDAGEVRVALAFPDVYEVGMSHLGLPLLYEALNRLDWAAAERVFAPWPDMEASLRSLGKPLTSLESGTPLARFDIVGFSLQYELSYTNVLTILELGGIPLLASERGPHLPLVIGGGPCAFNPEPLAPFFDAVALGDGEELIIEIAETMAAWKKRGGSRLDLLREISSLEGMYVPAFFEPAYEEDGRVAAVVPRFPDKASVRKRMLPALDLSCPPLRPLVPATHIIHDRLGVEVVRGCTRGCRFCQAGFIYRPVRERAPQEVWRLVEQGLNGSGYDEFSLLSLSIGDYTYIQPLLQALVGHYSDRRIAVSLPSLRVGTLDETMIAAIRRVRKTGFTLAPEAGSERLRRVINKGISGEELLATVKSVYDAGWPLLKLYFMMGLPTEEGADRQALVDLSLAVWREAAKRHPRRRLHVSVSTFVPKPHTPFQWEAQLDPQEMERNLDLIRKGLSRKGIQVKWNQPFQSMLEGVFARGDRRLASVLLRAQRLGCRFDGWSEELRPGLWRRAFAEEGLDPSFYAARRRDRGEVFPWEHLDCRVHRDYLWQEYERALAGETTLDCRLGGCIQCGVCGEKGVGLRLQHGSGPLPSPRAEGPADPKGTHRYRLLFAKTDQARFLGHLEMVSALIRAMRRAGLPLAYTQGHHPVPRISLGDALPLGMESRDEAMEIILREPLDPHEVGRRLNVELPPGLAILEARVDGAGRKSPGRRLVTYEAALTGKVWPAEGFRRFRERDLAPLQQKAKRGSILIPLEAKLRSLDLLAPDRLRCILEQTPGCAVRVREALAHIFGLSGEEVLTARIMKISSRNLEEEGDAL